MKTKLTRKIFAVLMVMALTLSMAVTVFAADNGKGTLKISGKDLKDKTVNIYQMFSLRWKDNDPTATTIGDEDLLAYDLNSNWEEFFQSELSSTKTGVALSDDAYAYVSALTTANIDAFAKKASQYALAIQDYSSRSPLTATKTSVGTFNSTTNKEEVTFSDVDAGYYLVVPNGSVSKNGKNATLVNVPVAGNETLDFKGQYPTVDKKVDSQDNNSAKVGDTVTFTLESEVPDMSDYSDHTKYKFSFVDTMSEGLTYITDSVSVKIGGKDVTAGYTVNAETVETNKTRLTVAFADLKEVKNADNEAITPGQKIVVTYSVKINDKAVIGTTGNENKAHVVFSNDPKNEASTDTSTDDTSKVYTYEVELDKYTGTYGTSATRLAGAVFEVKYTANGTAVPLVSTGTDKYRIATAEEIANDAINKVTQVTTPASGKITIDGFSAGTGAGTTYYFEEVAAPIGYNKLAAPVEVTISVQNGADGKPDYTKPYYKVGIGAAQENNKVVPVENNTGTLLPTTGGIGTIGLTVLGVGVVIFGFVFTSKKKKKAE